MVDITLFELHVDGDPQFEPSWRTGEADESPDEDDGNAADVDEGSGGAGGKVLVGLVALVAVAVVARKLRGGDEEFEEEPEYTVEEPA